MGLKFPINVSLAVFKALTARLHEGQTHDDVIRDLLEIDSIAEPELPSPFEGVGAIAEAISRGMHARVGGFHSRGLWLPDGTQLRARYKQKLYSAEISGGQWIDDAGGEHPSPSAAASAITSTNVNGLRFWEAKRPTDNGWCRLEALAGGKQ
jgi:hypothetical protein